MAFKLDGKIMTKWSERNIEQMAKENPVWLVNAINANELDYVELSWAGEHLSDVSHNIAVPCLLALVGHPKPVTREGAMLGLYGHLDQPGVVEAIKKISKDDPLKCLRDMATEIINEI